MFSYKNSRVDSAVGGVDLPLTYGESIPILSYNRR